MAYLPRVADDELGARLASAGAVVIEGTKATGKTETARRMASSTVFLDVDENARRAAAVDPTLVLEGRRPSSDRRMAGRARPVEPRAPSRR